MSTINSILDWALVQIPSPQVGTIVVFTYAPSSTSKEQLTFQRKMINARKKAIEIGH